MDHDEDAGRGSPKAQKISELRGSLSGNVKRDERKKESVKRAPEEPEGAQREEGAEDNQGLRGPLSRWLS